MVLQEQREKLQDLVRRTSASMEESKKQGHAGVAKDIQTKIDAYKQATGIFFGSAGIKLVEHAIELGRVDHKFGL